MHLTALSSQWIDSASENPISCKYQTGEMIKIKCTYISENDTSYKCDTNQENKWDKIYREKVTIGPSSEL